MLLQRWVDASSYTGPIADFAWLALKAQGVVGVWIQCWGGRSPNPYAENQLWSARKMGLMTGIYGLVNFVDPPGTLSGVAQAKRTMQAAGQELRHILWCAIDVETVSGIPGWPNNNVGPIPSNIERIKHFEWTLLDGHIPPVIYTGGPSWHPLTGNVNDWSAAGYGLIHAAFHGADWPTHLPLVSYGGWQQPCAWQWKNTTVIEGESFDLNVFDDAWVKAMLWENMRRWARCS